MYPVASITCNIGVGESHLRCKSRITGRIHAKQFIFLLCTRGSRTSRRTWPQRAGLFGEKQTAPRGGVLHSVACCSVSCLRHTCWHDLVFWSVSAALIVRVASLSNDTLRHTVTLGYVCGPRAQVASVPNWTKFGALSPSPLACAMHVVW